VSRCRAAGRAATTDATRTRSARTRSRSFGVIARPSRTRWRLGPDSLLALALFGLGVAGLFVVAS